MKDNHIFILHNVTSRLLEYGKKSQIFQYRGPQFHKYLTGYLLSDNLNGTVQKYIFFLIFYSMYLLNQIKSQYLQMIAPETSKDDILTSALQNSWYKSLKNIQRKRT